MKSVLLRLLIALKIVAAGVVAVFLAVYLYREYLPRLTRLLVKPDN